jgi:TonB family protein
VVTGGFDTASGAITGTATAGKVSTRDFGDSVAEQRTISRRPLDEGVHGGFSAQTAQAETHAKPDGVQGQFAAAAVAAPTRSGPAASVPGEQTALQIVSKPRPAYTEEARRLRIEGEVLLETWFGASGQIRVLRVVQSLGHGLDENAADAARNIRFVPPERSGRPIDTVAMVRITFSLAY